MSNGLASFVTEVSPRASRARIARRVGSARAENVVSRELEVLLTIWLNIISTMMFVKSQFEKMLLCTTDGCRGDSRFFGVELVYVRFAGKFDFRAFF